MERHNILQQSANYSWIDIDLLHTRLDLIMRRYKQEDEMYDVSKSFHSEPCGGHFADKRTT